MKGKFYEIEINKMFVFGIMSVEYFYTVKTSWSCLHPGLIVDS